MSETYQIYQPEHEYRAESEQTHEHGWNAETIEEAYTNWLSASIAAVTDDRAKSGEAVQIVLKRPNNSDKWLPPGIDCPPDADMVEGLREKIVAKALDVFELADTGYVRETRGRVHLYGQDYDKKYDNGGPVLVTRRQSFRDKNKTELTADILFLERK